MKLILPDALAAQITSAAKAAAPRECCGLVEGLRNGDDVYATALHPAKNLSEAADCFDIAPADHIAASKTARARGRMLIGCYHSHPGGVAKPSARDVAGGAEENFLWLIAGSDRLAGFVYRAGDFEEIAIGVAIGADLVTSSSNERS